MSIDSYNDLVSVIVPYYNNEKTIIRAIESVVNQQYKNLELIIINDGSTDNSYKIVCEYLKKIKGIRTLHISQKNLGPSVARNNGIKKSKGKYIAFLDSDDSWELIKIKRQIEFLKENKHVDMLGCNFNILDEKNRIKKHYFVKSNKKITFRNMLYKHYYATPCVIVKKEVLLKSGLFNEGQFYMEDSLLFTTICRKFNAHMTNEFLVNTYKNSFGQSGLSKNIQKMQKYEIYNFRTLYHENRSENKKIYLIEYIFIMLFSYLKFIRRNAIVLIRKWR